MSTRSLFPRMARSMLACALVFGLIPAIAFADEARTTSNVVERFAEKSAEATARYTATGNPDDLRDVEAYEDSSSIMPLTNAVFPGKLDLRDEGAVTPVKQQSPWGSCWSFGAIAACETSIMSELGWSVAAGQTVDLSELHTAWFAYTALPDGDDSQAGEGFHSTSEDPNHILNVGGMPYTVTSVLSSGTGPVAEIDAPYRNSWGWAMDKDGDLFTDENGKPVAVGPDTPTDDLQCYAPAGPWAVPEELRFQQVLELEESSVLPSPAARSADGTYRYNQAGTDAIKGELAAGRAVEIGFAADTSQPGQTDPAKFINTDTWAHYTYDETEPITHAVCIVGWDDSYSKSNFIAGHQPEQDGAWIVKNSWGSVEEQFPNGGNWGLDGTGYFYLSYYDKSIQAPESFNFYTETYGQSADYYLINQYDYLPSDGVTTTSYEKPTSMANVFEAEEHQRVRSLSCETASPNTTATYELYLLNDGFSNPTDGKLLTKETVTYAYGGYHRLQLDEGFPIEQGQHFSVVVTLQCNDGYEVLVDRATNKNGMEADSHLYAVGVVNPGESYVNNDGTWDDWASCVEDIKAKAAQTPAGDIFDYDNFAIKAYADPMGAPPIHEAVVVPDLAGMTEAEALAALEEAGLRGEAGEPEYSDDVEVGRVLSQTTAAGTEVDKDYIVTYILSLGKNPSVVVPPTPAPGPDEEAGGSPGGKPGNPAPDAKSLVSTGDVTLPLVVTAAAVAVLGAVGAVTTLIVARKRTHRAHPRRR